MSNDIADRGDRVFWWEESPLIDPARHDFPERVDVIIIGGGFTGLVAAYYLARAGRDVVVCEAERPGEGASSRNGGIASGSLRLDFSAAIARYGTERAASLFNEGKAAREHLQSLMDETDIDADFQCNGRFTGALTPRQADRLAREADLLRVHTGIEAWAVRSGEVRREIDTDLYCGGMVRTDIGHLHPGRLHAGLVRATERAGVRIYGHTRAVKHHRSGGDFVVELCRRAEDSSGKAETATLRGAHLLIATNGYSDSFDPWLRRRLVPVLSRIVVTPRLSTAMMESLLPQKRAMGESRRLFRYYRPTPDGRHILLGCRERIIGGDRIANTRHVWGNLTDIFPILASLQPAFSWHGYVAMNREHRPRLFCRDGVFYACGYCGSGVVWAPWLGMKIARKMIGAAEAPSFFDADPPPSIPFYTGRPWFLPTMMMGYRGRDWFDERAARRDQKRVPPLKRKNSVRS